eukprot:jgi/Chlat1/4353/Chrsp29S04510
MLHSSRAAALLCLSSSALLLTVISSCCLLDTAHAFRYVTEIKRHRAILASRRAGVLPKGGGECKDDWDCSLGGDCKEGLCECHMTWTGPNCAILHLLPVDREQVGYRPHHRRCRNCTWGANSVYYNGKHHLFVAEMASGKGLDGWIRDSQVIHAVADFANGPFTKVRLVHGPERHNPTLHRHPDGTYLLYSIAQADESIVVAFASSPEDEFVDLPGTLLRGRHGRWDGTVTNPGVWIHANGTVFLYYRGTDQFTRAEYIGLAVCEGGWNGTYRRVVDKPLFSHQSEDPFVWRDSNGNFHMLTNGMPGWLEPKWTAGGHAWSRDGVVWSELQLNAFNTTIQYTDGVFETFLRRERPQVIFNSKGLPEWFYTGVMGAAGSYKEDYSFTLVQRVYTGEAHLTAASAAAVVVGERPSLTRPSSPLHDAAVLRTTLSSSSEEVKEQDARARCHAFRRHNNTPHAVTSVAPLTRTLTPKLIRQRSLRSERSKE